jgi:hypothetical protein
MSITAPIPLHILQRLRKTTDPQPLELTHGEYNAIPKGSTGAIDRWAFKVIDGREYPTPHGQTHYHRIFSGDPIPQ